MNNRAKVFDMMAEAGPIGKQMVEVLEKKGVPIPTWVVAMCMSVLSIELNGEQVTPDFVHGILKTIYEIQRQAAKADKIDSAITS